MLSASEVWLVIKLISLQSTCSTLLTRMGLKASSSSRRNSLICLCFKSLHSDSSYVTFCFSNIIEILWRNRSEPNLKKNCFKLSLDMVADANVYFGLEFCNITQLEPISGADTYLVWWGIGNMKPAPSVPQSGLIAGHDGVVMLGLGLICLGFLDLV